MSDDMASFISLSIYNFTEKKLEINAKLYTHMCVCVVVLYDYVERIKNRFRFSVPYHFGKTWITTR